MLKINWWIDVTNKIVITNKNSLWYLQTFWQKIQKTSQLEFLKTVVQTSVSMPTVAELHESTTNVIVHAHFCTCVFFKWLYVCQIALFWGFNPNLNTFFYVTCIWCFFWGWIVQVEAWGWKCPDWNVLHSIGTEPQFYIQLVYKPHFGTWIILFGSFGQLRAELSN